MHADAVVLDSVRRRVGQSPPDRHFGFNLLGQFVQHNWVDKRAADALVRRKGHVFQRILADTVLRGEVGERDNVSVRPQFVGYLRNALTHESLLVGPQRVPPSFSTVPESELPVGRRLDFLADVSHWTARLLRSSMRRCG